MKKIVLVLFVLSLFITGVYSQSADTDNDGIVDSEELAFGSDGYITNPYSIDTDNDGLSDFEETISGTDKFFTNPCNSDSDNDGIQDGSDFIPAVCYIDVTVSGASLPGGEIFVTAKIRDLYANIIEKDGIEFSLNCAFPAVFSSSAEKGTIFSGEGTQSVQVQTDDGEVIIKVTCSSVADISVWAVDSAGLNLICFSAGSPYQLRNLISGQPDNRFTDTGMAGEIDMFVNDIPLGFDFEFYGSVYQKINIHSNGFLTFDKNIPFANMYNNTNIPNPSLPNSLIAPFWDDLDATDATIMYFTNICAGGKSFHTRWKNIPFFNDVTASLTFDAIIYEKTGIIRFSYQQLQNGTGNYARGSSATVGVENQTGTKAVKFSYNTNSLSQNTSIFISTKPYPVAYFLDPSQDTDFDGITNYDEINVYYTNPLSSDSDSDGLPDKWEIDYGLDPNSSENNNGANGDPDNDLLSNIDELRFATDPTNPDSDYDLIYDGLEVHVYFTIPSNPDTDLDTLIDGEEIVSGADGFVTNPLDNDSDDDGLNDNVDPIPVYAKLVIIKPSDAYCGYTSTLKLQLWSHDGYLLYPVNDFSCAVQVSGSAYFIGPAEKGAITSGQDTNSIIVSFYQGEAWVKVKNYADEEVYFTAWDIGGTSVWFAPAQKGFVLAPYNLRAIANGANLLSLSGDDLSIEIPIGFNFRFFGNVYQHIKVSTNGYLTFATSSTDSSNDNIPDIREPNNYIAPFWDDLITSGGAVYACVTGSAPARSLVVYWNNVCFAANTLSRVSFQAIIHEIDSTVEFQFGILSGVSSPVLAYGNSATTGIENASGSAGVLINYNSGALSSNTGYFVYDGIKPSMRFIKNPAGDDDFDGVTNEVEWLYGTDQFNSDTDNDGLSDGAEIYTYQTDPLNIDSDNDGFTDYEEIIAGTDPKDAQSYLAVISITIDPPTSDVIIQWKSRPNISYTIFAKSQYSGGQFVVLTDNYLSQGEITSYTDQGGGPNALPHPCMESKGRLYKISVISN